MIYEYGRLEATPEEIEMYKARTTEIDDWSLIRVLFFLEMGLRYDDNGSGKDEPEGNLRVGLSDTFARKLAADIRAGLQVARRPGLNVSDDGKMAMRFIELPEARKLAGGAS